jgi:streptogramin lyase
MKAASKIEERILAPWIGRIGVWSSVLSALTLLIVLVGDVAVLIFHDTPANWQLAVLRIGPVVALVMGTIGGYTSWYHWLRLLVRWVVRHQRPVVRKEALGAVADQGLNVPGLLDSQVRHHSGELRGGLTRLQSWLSRAAVGVVVASAVVGVATIGPLSAPPPSGAAPSGPETLKITELPLSTPLSQPGTPILGPDDNFWTIDGSVPHHIDRITPAGVVTPFPLPDSVNEPYALIVGPDHSLWFLDGSSAQLDRMTLTGEVTGFQADDPHTAGEQYGLTSGPDGNLWFTDNGVGIGRMTPTGAVTYFPIPTTSNLSFGRITPGPDGNLWYLAGDYSGPSAVGRIGRISPSGSVTEFPIPLSDSQPTQIAVGADGNLWFTLSDHAEIGRITPAGVITLFSITIESAAPADYLIAGPDHTLWFAESAVTPPILGRMSTRGVVTRVLEPADCQNCVSDFIVGPDHTFWFIDATADKIGRFAP